MPLWLKALLSGITGFGTSFLAVNQSLPAGSKGATTVGVIVGAVTAANSIANLFVTPTSTANPVAAPPLPPASFLK